MTLAPGAYYDVTLAPGGSYDCVATTVDTSAALAPSFYFSLLSA